MARKMRKEAVRALDPAISGTPNAADYLRGDPAEVIALDRVKPNAWNPNRMTPEMFASLKHGMVKDGWPLAYPLLVWGLDDNDKERNIIIDGEHRWRAARALGFATGPVVFLNGIPLAQAKALTVKLDQKRGQFEQGALATLLREIQDELLADGEDDLGMALGFGDEELMALLGEPADEATSPDEDAPETDPEDGEGASTRGPSVTEEVSHVRMVQLFLSETTVIDFMSRCRALGDRYKTGNVTDTVFEAVRREAERTE